MIESQRSVHDWTERVSEQEMPAIADTVREIEQVAKDEHSPMSRLSDIILKDPAMTMHVLRLTDSAYHIPRKNRQNTISRALVMLGIDEVCSMCLSVSVFDPLLKHGGTPQLTNEIAQAFHTAMQARALAVQHGDPASEEVFIAALLMNLGEMVFWCFGGTQVEALARELAKPGAEKVKAEQKVLGFSLKELTASLGQKWGLGKLHQEVLDESSDNPRVRAISLASRFVNLDTDCDPGSLSKTISEMAEYSGQPEELVYKMLEGNIEKAAATADVFGAAGAVDKISEMLKVLKKGVQPADAEKRGNTEGLTIAPGQGVPTQENKISRLLPTKVCPEPDPMFQLKILRDLTSMMEAGINVSGVLEMILEGIYYGVGMDRALFALLSPNKRYLRVKDLLGGDRDLIFRRFKFELDPSSPTIFSEIIAHKRTEWIRERLSSETKRRIPPHISKVIGESPFFVAAAVVDSQTIGCFFADRHVSSRPLDLDSFESFKQFTVQANMALEYLGKY